MANNKVQETKPKSNKFANFLMVLGITFGTVAVAGAVAPIVHLLAAGISFSAAAAGALLSVVSLVVSHKIKKQHKMQQENTKVEEHIKEKDKVEEQTINQERVVEHKKEEEKQDDMSQYRISEVEPASFTIYEKNSDIVKKDSNNKMMRFKISKNLNEYIPKLYGYLADENLGDCDIQIVDKYDKEFRYSVKDGEYRNDMKPVFGKIQAVSKSLSQPTATENDDKGLILEA